MSRAQAALLARRRVLLDRASVQREELTRGFDDLGRTFRGADHVFRVVEALDRRAPQLALGATVVSLFLGPGRITRWAGRAWTVFQTVRSLLSSKKMP